MILAIFLAVCGVGTLLGLSLPRTGRAGQVVTVVALAGAAAAGAALGTGGQKLVIADTALVTTSYATAFLTVAAASCLLVAVVGVAAHPSEAVTRFGPAALAAIGGFGVALTSSDPRVSLMAGAAAMTTGTLTLVHRPDDPDGDGRVVELRILALTAGALLLAGIVAVRPAWTGPEDRALGAAFLALALAVAVRSGAIPFHLPASSLLKNATPSASALLLILLPAGLGALVLTWSPIAFHAQARWMELGIGGLQAIALATIILGSLAALVHDQLDEVVAYSIVADAGFILAALAARSEDAQEPARLWLLVFVAGKTALVAWAAAMGRAFATSDVPSLRGWLRRTPLLGVCLVAIAAATIGWPGSGAASARADIVRLGLPGQLQSVGPLAIVLSAAYYLRLLAMGVLRPTPTVRESWSERPRLGFALRRPKSASTAAAIDNTAATGQPSPAAPAGTEAPQATPAPAPTRKRRGKGAAAEIASASVSAEVPAAEVPAAEVAAAEVAGPQDVEGAGGPVPPESPAPQPKKLVLTRRRRGPSLGHRLGVMWRVNRTLEVSGVMAMGAVFALAVAAGSFGSNNAAKAGLPLGTAAHATSTLRPTPSLPPTQGPLTTGTPIPSASASGSHASLVPTQSGPIRTSAPSAVIK